MRTHFRFRGLLPRAPEGRTQGLQLGLRPSAARGSNAIREPILHEQRTGISLLKRPGLEKSAS
eukprot:2092579-Rhodomonas_salina.2